MESGEGKQRTKDEEIGEMGKEVEDGGRGRGGGNRIMVEKGR